MRNHREEIECALAGGAPDCVPFTFYDHIFPPGFDPAPLQAKGMAICARPEAHRRAMTVRASYLPAGDEEKKWRGPYIKQLRNDPWGHPYQYVCPGAHNASSFDLWSAGGDGKEEIGNW